METAGAGAGPGPSDVTERRAALAEAYHVRRCVLGGELTPEAGAEALARLRLEAEQVDEAFATQAAETPRWAVGVLQAAQARSCREEKP